MIAKVKSLLAMAVARISKRGMGIHLLVTTVALRKRLTGALVAVTAAVAVGLASPPTSVHAAEFSRDCVLNAYETCGYFDQYRQWYYFRSKQDNFSENQTELCAYALKETTGYKEGSTCVNAPPNHEAVASFNRPDLRSKPYGFWRGSGNGRRVYVRGCTDYPPYFCF